MPVASLLPTQKTVDTNNRYHEPMSRDQQNAQGPLGSGSQARRYGGLDSRTDTRPRVHSHPVERDAPISLDHVQMIQVGGDELPVLGWKERVRHFTWTWFTLTMATGGIANVIHNVPLRFTGLYAIGCFFFILNLVLFVFNSVCMALRFYHWPYTFRASFLHPTESLFVPASIISTAVICVNICEYGMSPGKTGMWLETTMTVFYWIYICLAMFASVGIYLLMWSTRTYTIAQMTPVWIFPAYPLLLVGPFASILSAQRTKPDNTALQVVVSGVIMQGIGFMLSLMIYAAYLYRLFSQKLPAESTRPGMFISVGPSGFTVSGLIHLGNSLPQMVPPQFMDDGHLAAQVGRIMAYWSGIWLWGLAIWFFFVSVGAHWSCVAGNRLSFAMTWYAFIFPNTALTTATFAVAKALGRNYPLEVIGCIMACALIVAWSFILGINIRAVALKHILWPQKQEDSDLRVFKKDLVKRQKRNLGALGMHSGIQSMGHTPPESRSNEKVKDEEHGNSPV